MMCGAMGGMGGMGAGMGAGFSQGQSLSEIFASTLSFLGQLASQLLIILTSGPVLGLLTALVLLLAIAVLLRLLLGRRRPVDR